MAEQRPAVCHFEATRSAAPAVTELTATFALMAPSSPITAGVLQVSTVGYDAASLECRTPSAVLMTP